VCQSATDLGNSAVCRSRSQLNTRAETLATARREATVSGSCHQGPELRKTRLAPLVIGLYKSMRGPGTASLRRLLSRLLIAFEGGQMRSASLRRLMSEVHGVTVGAHSYGCFDPLRFPAGVTVGRYVSVGPNVAAYRRNHPMDRLSLHPYFYRPVLGASADADVETASLEIAAGSWLGANVLVLPGCRRIGRGAVIAAGAVLTKDVPDYAIVGGNPAKLIRYRFSPQGMTDADATRWWQRSPEDVVARYDVAKAWNKRELSQIRGRSCG